MWGGKCWQRRKGQCHTFLSRRAEVLHLFKHCILYLHMNKPELITVGKDWQIYSCSQLGQTKCRRVERGRLWMLWAIIMQARNVSMHVQQTLTEEISQVSPHKYKKRYKNRCRVNSSSYVTLKHLNCMKTPPTVGLFWICFQSATLRIYDLNLGLFTSNLLPQL